MEIIIAGVMAGGALVLGALFLTAKRGARRNAALTKEAWDKAGLHFDLFHEEYVDGPHERALRGEIAEVNFAVSLKREEGTDFTTTFTPPLPIDYIVRLGESQNPTGDARFDKRFSVQGASLEPVSSTVRSALSQIPVNATRIKLDANTLQITIPKSLCSLRELQHYADVMIDVSAAVQRERQGGGFIG